MPKNALRRELLAHRSALSVADWQRNSCAAQTKLMELSVFQRASSIALYAPFQNEVDTTKLFRAALQLGKKVDYPLVCGDNLQFYHVSSDEQLITGNFGIPEPCTLRCAQAQYAHDLMVVPGVGFDLQGRRVGFGRGYYDRYLATLKRLPVLIGLCHDFQLCDAVPVEGHDIGMDYVVTDCRVLQLAVTDRFRWSDDHI